MACGRRHLVALWALVLVAQVLAQEDALEPLAEAAEEEMSFFQRMLHAAKGLVWSHSPNATQPVPTEAPVASTTPAQFYATGVKTELEVNFSLQVLNEDLTVSVEPGVYAEGRTIRIQAALQADAGLFPKLFVDECYALDAPHPSQSRRAFLIVGNHGCLYAGDSEATWFRKDDSTVVLTLQTPAFLLDSESEQIHFHCLLVAWSQKLPTSSGKKTCSFDRVSAIWKNTDEPSKPSVCHCCSGFCPSEPHPLQALQAFSGEGRLHRAALGPLRVRKEDLPWFEGRCQTMKKLLLVSVAFVGSCVLAALFLGTLLALGLGLFRYSRTSWGHRLLRGDRTEHTELQTVAEALAVAEEIDRESTLDYCKLQSDSPEKDA